MSDKRAQAWRRNERLERLLRELNELLEPAERSLCQRGAEPRYPTLLIVGPPRSGTTLLHQWLAASGRFAYPTNLMSRFFRAPAIGAKLQLLLTDRRFTFRDELWDLAGSTDFSSDLGKTRGALAPNEFWYFWRRFLPNEEPRHLDDDEVGRIDDAGLRCELAAIETVFDSPLAMKAMIVQYNLPVVSTILPRAVFLHVRRDPFYNVQSLLEARERYFGDRSRWYSVKPPEYPSLVQLDPVRQVAAQVHYTNRSVARGLSTVGPERSICIDYEQFCKQPQAIYAELCNLLDARGYEPAREYRGPASFDHTNQLRVDPADERSIREACDELTSGEAGA